MARRFGDDAKPHGVIAEVIGDARNDKSHDRSGRVSSYGTYGQRSRYGTASSFHRVADVGAFSSVAVPVEASRKPVVIADVQTRVDVVHSSMLVSTNSVKPNRLCASERREQQQEKEAKHDDLRCDGEIIGAKRQLRKIVQTLS